MRLSISLLLLSIFSIHPGSTRKIPDINWISSNPIFDVSNTDHVISVHIGDRVSIKCPKSDETGKYEYSYIYMVSDEEYDHCFLAKPRLVGACDNQTINASINIVFRSFTPTPGGFEFQPGKNYFLISTSDGTQEGIDRKKDGLCSTKQMKIKFEVEPDRRGSENPKFAARTLKKDRDASEQSTPVMYVVHDGNDIDDEKIKVKAFVGFPSPTSSIFDWVPFHPFGLKQSTPLIRLKVRAYNRVVYTKKDTLLKEVEDVKEYKKQQEKQFEQNHPTSLEEPEINVNEPDKMYEKGEEPKIFLFPKQGETVSKIGGEMGKVEELAHENEDSTTEKPKDDDFQIMYDDELKEYVLKRRPPKMDRNGVIDSWNGGDSKERGDDGKREKVVDEEWREEEDEDDEARRILESEEDGIEGSTFKNRTVAGGTLKKKKNHTEVTLEEEEMNLD
ncbi:hypothetical protein CAEBREN_29472, partial [Caenorhabditis brenneri]